MTADYSLYLVTDASLSRGQELPRDRRTPRSAAARRWCSIARRGRRRGPWSRRRGALRDLCRSRGVPFIVNDRADVALAVDADGLHVGQDDLPAALARRILGSGRILGVSAGSLEEALRAVSRGGRLSGREPRLRHADEARRACADGHRGPARARRRPSALPSWPSGASTPATRPPSSRRARAGIAVVSAIVSADDVEAAARALREIIDGARSGKHDDRRARRIRPHREDTPESSRRRAATSSSASATTSPSSRRGREGLARDLRRPGRGHPLPQRRRSVPATSAARLWR